MSRPSATQSPRESSARCLSTSAARTAGSAARREARSEISGVRIASRDVLAVEQHAVAVEGDVQARRVAVAGQGDGAVHRPRVEVREAERVRRSARATVDFPAPAGPSMATQHRACHDRGVKLLRPLRERDFALLWTGMTISLLGDGIFVVAEAWQVYDLDNDPRRAVDRRHRVDARHGRVPADRRASSPTASTAAGPDRSPTSCAPPRSSAMGVLSLTGAIEIWHLVALVGASWASARRSSGPRSARSCPRSSRASSSSRPTRSTSSSRQAAARLAGPAIGGLLVAAIGVGRGVPRRRGHVRA